MPILQNNMSGTMCITLTLTLTNWIKSYIGNEKCCPAATTTTTAVQSCIIMGAWERCSHRIPPHPPSPNMAPIEVCSKLLKTCAPIEVVAERFLLGHEMD